MIPIAEGAMILTDPGQTRPLALARLTRTHARLARGLARRSPQLELKLPEGTLALCLRLAEGGADLSRRPIHWRHEGGSLWLELDEAQLRQWLKPWIGELDPEQLPPLLRTAALQAALGPLLAALEGLLGMQLTADANQTATQNSTANVLALYRLEAETPSLAHLGLDEAASRQLAARLEQDASDPDIDFIAERWPDLPLILTPWLGSIRLRVAEWRTLEPGDLLLLPRQVDPAAIPLYLRQGGRRLALAQLSGQRLIIASLGPQRMSEPSPSAPDQKSAPPALDPDGLEIDIDLELASLKLPLRELRALQPGYCLELPDLDRPRIRLVVGGRLIGHGELVLIEDHLGVRITELFGGPTQT